MRERMQQMVERVQDEVCTALEVLDGGSFREDLWERPGGGGGRTRVLQGGGYFEKAGVNVSAIHGTMPAAVAEAARGKGIDLGRGEPRFFATGVSLVLHPHHPMAPTAHANYRYFEAEGESSAWWFGGGTDLTPTYLVEEDVRHFHRVLAETCDRHDRSFYPRFKRACDDYFRIVHRDECRGVGGIFFDDLNDREPDRLFPFVEACAGAILPALLPIYERRGDTPATPEQRRWQQLRRGRYVEFNLVYDRGTMFGLKTAGRIESILMSLPLTARWEYAADPAPGTPEAEMLEVLRSPRDWV